MVPEIPMGSRAPRGRLAAVGLLTGGAAGKFSQVYSMTVHCRSAHGLAGKGRIPGAASTIFDWAQAAMG